MRYIPIYIIAAVGFLLSASLQAQTADDVRRTYLQHTGNFALLYNGQLEAGYAHGYANTPYYPNDYVEGTLSYKGMNYRDVPMRLDCYTGQLVAQSPNKRFNITLEPENVKRATLGERTFVYLDKKADGAPESTYFVAIYEGKGWGIYKQCYVNNINKEYADRHLLVKFSLKERLYFVKDRNWSPLGGRNDFIRHFKRHKQALLQFCKEQHLQLNKENEENWNRLGRYCATLME